MSRWLPVAIVAYLVIHAGPARADDMLPEQLPSFGAEESPQAPAHSAASLDVPREYPSAPFGARGQFAILGSSNAYVSYTSYSSGASFLYAELSTEAYYFIARNLAIGLDLDTGYSDTRGFGADSSLVETRSTSFVLGPRIGYAIPLGRYASLFPTAAFAAGSSHSDERVLQGKSLSIAGSPTGSASTTEADARMELDAQILFHPRPHVTFGLGPYFTHDFARVQGGPDVGAQATTIGAGFVVGGYAGGTSPASDAPPRSERRPLHHFGDARTWLFTNELETQGYYTTHAGTGSTSGAFQLLFGADRFVLPHFSIGGIMGFAVSSTRGIDATTKAEVDDTAFSYNVGPRIGYEIRIVDGVSIYPRGTFVVGITGYDETSAGQENSFAPLFATAGASLPLIVEPATHFVVGFGPYVSRDLARAEPNGSNNLTTVVGASLLVGAWL